MVILKGSSFTQVLVIAFLSLKGAFQPLEAHLTIQRLEDTFGNPKMETLCSSKGGNAYISANDGNAPLSMQGLECTFCGKMVCWTFVHPKAGVHLWPPKEGKIKCRNAVLAIQRL